jgi:F0F1-type ATP synthase membrane subunit b/b'
MDRLERIRKQIEVAKREFAKAEANFETFTQQREELVKQMDEYGVTPETIGEELTKLGLAINEGLMNLELMIQNRG